MYFSKAVLISIAVFLQVTAIQARVSKDDRCGMINGEKVTCPSGECCSSFGWCGTSKEHCVTDCLFQCKKPKPTTSVKPTSKPSTTVSTGPKPTKTIISSDWTCGLKGKILVQCPSGYCCSEYGYCGNTEEYCKNPQPTTSVKPTGKPSTTVSTSPNPTKTVISSDWTCGLKVKVLVQCPSGYCCSEYGYCGNTEEYCGSNPPQPTNPPVQPGGKVPTGKIIETCNKAGTFAVTFDDGPSEYTGQLLDDLKARNVKVTFFVVGEMLESDQGRKFLKRAYDEGHHIASHTYTHISLAKTSESKIRSEMTKTADAIFKVIGKRPQYMRPPYGEYNAKALTIMKDMGYKVINWNVDTLDWEHKNSQKTLKVYKDVLAKANLKNDRFISLQHDIQPSTIKAAAGILDTVIKSGFKITTVADCLGDSELYH
ncbi:hypothetical protein K7432_006900 [Basidiobolus ranarum]|uniref:Glycoside hydrolase/deacetylase n=1 Tax=Basidiobolus ranarum TaxID=34480 RepID=A0ABR2W1U1_9FUNG